MAASHRPTDDATACKRRLPPSASRPSPGAAQAPPPPPPARPPCTARSWARYSGFAAGLGDGADAASPWCRSRCCALRRRRLARSASASRASRAAWLFGLGGWSLMTAPVCQGAAAGSRPDNGLDVAAHPLRRGCSAAAASGIRRGTCPKEPCAAAVQVAHRRPHAGAGFRVPFGLRPPPPDRGPDRRPRRCRSSGVEHSLGKGEVECSNHSGSTTAFPRNSAIPDRTAARTAPPVRRTRSRELLTNRRQFPWERPWEDVRPLFHAKRRRRRVHGATLDRPATAPRSSRRSARPRSRRRRWSADPTAGHPGAARSRC